MKLNEETITVRTSLASLRFARLVVKIPSTSELLHDYDYTMGLI
jgi:hypothetical protein